MLLEFRPNKINTYYLFLCNRFAVVVSVVTIATGFSRSYYYATALRFFGDSLQNKAQSNL